jgi:hypothetical protein
MARAALSYEEFQRQVNDISLAAGFIVQSGWHDHRTKVWRWRFGLNRCVEPGRISELDAGQIPESANAGG